MCGIVGLVNRGYSDERISQLVARMTDAVIHRGPDGGKIWSDRSGLCGLGHRRLSVIDLSQTGAQPMVSSSGRYVVTFNGEIYNHKTLRQRLDCPAFRGTSDTETLLECVEKFGPDGTLPMLTGMFAIAIWDRKDRVLFLARDRFGEKPIYYGTVGKGLDRSFVFASELKCFHELPFFDRTLSTNALLAYARDSFIPAPLSVYQDVYKLPQGCFLRIDPFADSIAPPVRWYTHGSGMESDPSYICPPTERVVANLDRILTNAVSSQLSADVPVGTFLSSGVDSTLVTSIAAENSEAKIQTFSLGFRNPAYDESLGATALASYIGTAHRCIVPSAADIHDAVLKLPTVYDEPFADSSQIPTLILSKFARDYVKVVLTGDGGDELFGGYNRYKYIPMIAKVAEFIGEDFRLVLRRISRTLANISIDRHLGYHYIRPFDRMSKVINAVYAARNDEDLYRAIMRQPSSTLVRADLIGETDKLAGTIPWDESRSFAANMMMADINGYLENDILVKVDRASMSVGLEARAPLLDHHLAEYCYKLPEKLKISRGTTKWILRKLLLRKIPRKLISTAKRGFAAPIGEYLRVDLREQAEYYFAPKKIEDSGLFSPKAVSDCWRTHLEGGVDLTSSLWPVFIFQSWYESQRSIKSTAVTR